MRAARFFIDAPLALHAQVELPAPSAHHALRVLRLHDGDPVVLFNGRGGEFSARLLVKGVRAIAEIQASHVVEVESPLAVTLIQAWIATDRLDWVVEKAVELGVHSILLAPSVRSVVRVAEARLGKRLERLRELILTACAQCGRNRIPQIEASASLADALRAGAHESAVAVLLDPKGGQSLCELKFDHRRVTLAVGPEGGFNDDEITLARQSGYHACRLGPRVLRTETAGLAALAALQTIAGDF